MNRFLKPIVETLHCNVSTALLLLLLCFQPLAFADLNTGLVAYWSFDDCKATDSSSNGNNGTQHGTQCVQGQIGKALDFNGTSDYVDIPFPQSLAGNTSFTASFWMKYEPTSKRQWVMFFGKPEAWVSALWLINPDRVQFGFWNVGNTDMENSFDISTFQSTWVYVSTVWNSSSGTLKSFINGVEKSTSYPTISPNIIPSAFSLGKNMCNVCGNFETYFLGQLDEIRIYNRVLTAAEVGALYQQGTTPSITSITPTETVIGKPTTFEVQGQNLNPNMGFTVGDCAYSNTALAGGTPQLQKFVCTQFGAAGTKQGSIKTKPGGTKLYGFNVTATLVPSTTPMATLTGRIKIGSSFGSNVTLSGIGINACKTTANGSFSCQVPVGWTGSLIPFAKGVSFSPGLIYVKNAQGAKNLNDATTTFAFAGTPLDMFPANGLMTSDWQKLPSDNAKWIISIANGEPDDLRTREGRFSYRSAPIGTNQVSAIQTTINVTQPADVIFVRRVSSNPGHGILKFYIDGQLKDQWSGNLNWKVARYPSLATGLHTLRWEYAKDAAIALGEDAAWIDALSYPASVKTRIIGQTAKESCVGITAGTLSLMTISNPTCEQVQAYLTWLKKIRLSNLNKAEIFINAVNGVDVQNQAIQKSIEEGAKIYAYVSPFFTSETIAERNFDLTFQLFQDIVPIVNCEGDPVTIAKCEAAKAGVYSLIEFGFKQAMGGLGTVNPYPYAAEKGLATFVNLGFAWDVNNLIEEINSINVADTRCSSF